MSYIGIYVMSSFCSLIVLFLIFKTLREKSIPKRSSKLFIYCMVSALVTLFSDTLNILIKIGYMHAEPWANGLIQIIYFIGLISICFTGMMLADAIDGFPVFVKKRQITILAIPAMIFCILVLLSPATHIIFYIDDAGQYQRGPANFLQFVFTGFYIVGALSRSILKLRNPKYTPYKESYIAVIIFFAMSFIGAIGQVLISTALNTDVILLEACISFSSIIIFIQLIQEQIAMDSLTGVCTRKFLFKYLEDKVERGNNLYLFMIDIDGFKRINDEFGHVEGDEALKIFSKTLKVYVDKHYGFIARYGGDEFVITFDISDEEVTHYVEGILTQIEYMNVAYDKNYKFAASIGYSKYQPNESISDFINRADEMMYHWKENHRKGVYTE